jgi:GNAT superfamily N-acetyltransferase
MLEIRPATPAEAPAISAFQILMARETEDRELDLDTVEAGVRAVFEDPGKGRYWVALSGDSCVASLLLTPEWSDWRNGEVLWIQSVYVHPDYRRQGVFAAMYARIRAEVEASEGLCGLRLYVDRSNLAAQEVYRSLGMDDQHYLLFEWLPEEG